MVKIGVELPKIPKIKLGIRFWTTLYKMRKHNFGAEQVL